MKLQLKSLMSSVISKKKAEAEASEQQAGGISGNGGQSEVAIEVEEEGDPEFKKDLMKRQKLCVVINIDNNLLDSVNWVDLAMEDHDYLSNSAVQSSLKEGIIYVSAELERTTKLRPYCRTFLANLMDYYDVVLYSAGSQKYLEIMADALDPQRKCRKTGRLQLVFELDDDLNEIGKGRLDAILSNRGVTCIVDCRERPWENKYAENLIKIDPYCYFVTKDRADNNNNNNNANSRLLPKAWIPFKGDECEVGGELSRLLRILRYAHILFFDEGIGDIREVIKYLKSRNKLYSYCFI